MKGHPCVFACLVGESVEFGLFSAASYSATSQRPPFRSFHMGR